jgi:hypothetical protein
MPHSPDARQEAIWFNICPDSFWSCFGLTLPCYSPFCHRNVYSVLLYFRNVCLSFLFSLGSQLNKSLPWILESLNLNFQAMLGLWELWELLEMDWCILDYEVSISLCNQDQNAMVWIWNVPHRLMCWGLGPQLVALILQVLETLGHRT